MDINMENNKKDVIKSLAINEKDMVNIKYWDLISIDKLSFEKGLVILRLSHKLATIIRICIGIVEVLPKGRLIRPLLNRF